MIMLTSTLIPAPAIPGLTVTRDEFGSGVNDAGVPYATFDIARPARDGGYPRMLASLTVYADSTTPLVWDRYTGDGRKGDMTAVQRVRDMLARDYPTARANSWRFTI
jgi:hypothetical protein